MLRFRPLAAAVLAFAGALACSGEPPTSPPITSLPRSLTAAEGEVVRAGNAFTFGLFRQTIASEPASGNVFISPLSVSMAFGMVLNGAAGVTESAMQNTLALSGLSRDQRNESYRSLIDLLRGLDPAVTFTIANSIWYRQEIVPPPLFLQTNRTSFDAEARALDFRAPASSAVINDWVKAATAGRIPDIVDTPLDPDGIMYLVNAIYFKANWASRFDAALTRDGPFHLAGGGTVQVPMMTHGKPVAVRMGSTATAQVLDLPYGGGAYSMTILLPHQSIDSVTAHLTASAWDAMIAGLDSTGLEIVLPRFTLRYDLDSAIPVLRQLGMVAAFCEDDDPRTDFSLLAPSLNACISTVKHKTFVLVDEAGTEAAAATSIGVRAVSAPMKFEVDRPFIFALRERFSGTILFIGRVMNPAAGG